MSSPISSCVRALWPEPIGERSDSSESNSLDWDEELDGSDDSTFFVWDEELEAMRPARWRQGQDSDTPVPLFIAADVVQPAPGIGDLRYSTPKNLKTPLEVVVYTSHWRVVWALFLLNMVSAWDTSMHPTPLRDTFGDLYTWLDPKHAEMTATFYLIDLMYHPRDIADTGEILRRLALLDPLLDWRKEVILPLQYKRFFLNNLGLPEYATEKIWKDHVQRDVVHQAILRCAMGVVAALDDRLSGLIAMYRH